MDIPLVHLIITVNAAGGVRPSGLFALRKAFPGALRRAIGCLGNSGGCTGGPECHCRSVLEQRVTPDPAALRRYQKSPFPFAFRFPDLKAGTSSGASVEISLVLIGETINLLEHYLSALAIVFGSSPEFAGVRCEKIDAVAAGGSRVSLWKREGCVDTSSLPLLSFADPAGGWGKNGDGIILELLTPTRILHRGEPLRDLQFSALAGALFRRISSLAYYFGGVELDHDFKWLAQRSREIVCTGSGLRWVNHGGGVQGIEGRVRYQGDLDDFAPYLALGELLNVGKGAAFGMGSYRITSM